jgi:predicted RNase H-like HicB family nuclease
MLHPAYNLQRYISIGGYQMKVKVVLEPSEEGGFTAYVPSLPGCISEGNSREEALENIREAIELYLEPVDDDMSLVSGTEIMELAL